MANKFEIGDRVYTKWGTGTVIGTDKGVVVGEDESREETLYVIQLDTAGRPAVVPESADHLRKAG